MTPELEQMGRDLRRIFNQMSVGEVKNPDVMIICPPSVARESFGWDGTLTESEEDDQ